LPSNKKKIKIALVYDAVYPYIKGGGEKRYFEIGKNLAGRGHEVHFYGMKLWKGENFHKQDDMYYHGICREMSLYNKNGKRSMKEAVLFGLHCLKLVKEDFDIMDCSSFPYFSLFSCKIASMFRRKPLVATWHEVWGRDYWREYLGPAGFFGYLIEKLAVLMPDKIISVSDYTTKLLKDRLKSRKPIYTIYNGIDLSSILSIPAADKKSDIVSAGRLVKHKNIDRLIRALDIVRDKKPDVKCMIIGDGPERKNLEKLVGELGLESNVEFTGFLKDQKSVYSHIKASKVFVLPSEREGFGIVVIEANACGIPVIAVEHENNAAVNLIENDVNGILCRSDEKEIANAILGELENKSDTGRKKECINLVREYDWTEIVNKIEETYLNVMDRDRTLNLS